VHPAIESTVERLTTVARAVRIVLVCCTGVSVEKIRGAARMLRFRFLSVSRECVGMGFGAIETKQAP